MVYNWKNTSGFTLVEMIVSIIIVMVVMTGATTFFVNFIDTQVKGVSYLNILSENMLDMQFLQRRIRQAFEVEVLDNEDDDIAQNIFESLLLKNKSEELGPYSLITTLQKPDEFTPEITQSFLAIKDFFIFNDIEIDTEGKNIFYADTGNHTIKKISLPSGEVSIVAGEEGEADGQGDSRFLKNPMGIALGDDGSIFIADSGNHQVKKVLSDGTVEVLWGTGVPGFNNETDPLSSQLHFPTDIELNSAQDIFIADSGNNRVRVLRNSGEVETLAGTGEFGYTFESENAKDADLNTPIGLTVDDNNNIYFTDGYNSRIAKIDGETGALINIAGSKKRVYSGDDGFALFAKLNVPTGIEFTNGELVFADSSNNVIRKIEPGRDNVLGTNDDKIRIVAGYTGRVFLGPGKDLANEDDDVFAHNFVPRAGFFEGQNEQGALKNSPEILMNNPSGVIADENNNIFFIDSLNNRVRFISAENSEIGIFFEDNNTEKDFVYTLAKNDVNTVLKSVDYNQFTFEGVNDFVGKNFVRTLQFTVPKSNDIFAHRFIEITMKLAGKQSNEESEVVSLLQTVVSLRNY